jgi:hypothetical protein
VARTRAADDFPAIRARMEELRLCTRLTMIPGRRTARGSYAISNRPGPSPAMRRAFLKVRTSISKISRLHVIIPEVCPPAYQGARPVDRFVRRSRGQEIGR